MTAILDPRSNRSRTSASVLAEARALGFELVTYESDAGQVIFEWRRGDEPRPQFVTRRVAVLWMSEFLESSRLRVG